MANGIFLLREPACSRSNLQSWLDPPKSKWPKNKLVRQEDCMRNIHPCSLCCVVACVFGCDARLKFALGRLSMRNAHAFWLAKVGHSVLIGQSEKQSKARVWGTIDSRYVRRYCFCWPFVAKRMPQPAWRNHKGRKDNETLYEWKVQRIGKDLCMFQFFLKNIIWGNSSDRSRNSYS